MWIGLKAIFAGLKLSKGMAFGAFSILGTIVSVYFLWSANNQKKGEILDLLVDKALKEITISELKTENSNQFDVIILCDINTKRLKELKNQSEKLALDERTARDLDNQRNEILHDITQAKLKKALAEQDTGDSVISDDLGQLFDEQNKALQATKNTRVNRDSDDD